MPADVSLPPLDAQATTSAFSKNAELLLQELRETLEGVSAEQLVPAATLIADAAARNARVFTYGAGRSGLALQMAAMRLMHLGLTVHVAGEVTAPAISAGDLLIVASASGASASAVHAAEVARKQDALVLTVTAQGDSALARLSTAIVTLRAATKQEFGARASRQYAGSLFEQAVLLLFDTLFHGFWQASGVAAESLMQRHANLE